MQGDVRMFECVFENMPYEVYIIHPETLKFVAANRNSRSDLGYSIEELSAMTILTIIPEFNHEIFYNFINQLLIGDKKQVKLSTLFRRKDGTIYPVELKIQLFDSDGEKLCMVLVDDFTKNNAAEDVLKEKIKMFSTIMDAVRDAIIILDDKGCITFWNMAAEQLFGYSEEEILGRELHRLLVPAEYFYEDCNKAFEHFRSTGTGNKIGKIMEARAKHKDGHEFDIELSLSALKIRDVLYAVGIVRDISARKKVQEDLEKSRERYLELAEDAPVGILSCDNNGNIIFVNRRALELLGSASTMETKKINLLNFPLLVKHGLSKKLEVCMQNKNPVMFETNYESKWGKKVWLRIHIRPQVSKNIVTGAQIIIDDIGEVKQLEKKLFLLSITDPLTNVYNRRYFIKRLKEEIGRTKRANSSFSIIMMDIDYFKSINDNFGHNSGDLVLKKIMAEVSDKIRNIDVLARWGGEEFIILLPETRQNEAAVMAERLRQCLCKIDIPEVGNVTASFGVAEYSFGDTVNKIVHKADIMMYKAKSAGRNCVRYMQ
jgi:diguanylate cyclase (GGDEF)-like protein/PAS domain S-box-containing protein